jgi:hypothetical protein
MKNMKILNLLIIIIMANGCKSQNDENNQNDKLSNKSKDEVVNIAKEIKEQDILIIDDNAITILLYPSEKEIDSLKKKWGEDEFYLAADGENGYSSSIFKLLKERKEKYINTDKKIIFFKESGLYFNKKTINNAWGVIKYKDKKYSFKSSIEYIASEVKNSSGSGEIKCEINEISDKYNFVIRRDNENPVSEKVLIDIENKKTASHQQINYNFNSLLSNEIPCNPISYFKNVNKIDEGIENFHSFIIGDFNFDGLEDFAYLWDSGGNGGPSYTYFFQNGNDEFIEAKDFPIQEGYFPKEINAKDKTLTLSGPVGCCKIGIAVYQLKKENKWKMIVSKEEDIK